MRKTIALILALLLLLAMAGCGRNDNPDHTDDWYDPDHIPEAPEQTDYIAVIRNEVFRADSVLSQAMSEKVELTLEEENEESILVSVTAPDVYAEALAWFDAVSEEEYSNEALEAKLLELMEGQPQTQQFTLAVQNGTLTYTDAFLDAMSCGVRDFYGALTGRIIAEMEESVHD